MQKEPPEKDIAVRMLELFLKDNLPPEEQINCCVAYCLAIFDTHNVSKETVKTLLFQVGESYRSYQEK